MVEYRFSTSGGSWKEIFNGLPSGVLLDGSADISFQVFPISLVNVGLMGARIEKFRDDLN